MTRWHVLAIIVLLAILGGLLWYSPTNLLPELSATPKASAHKHPNAYLINTKTTQYSETGDIAHTLIASKMRQFDQSSTLPKGSIELDHPLLTFFGDETSGEKPWIISSQQGVGDQKLDELLLSDNVVLKQSTADGEPLIMTGDTLLVRPNEQYAETDKPVMMKSASGITFADGAKISLENGLIEFTSNVRSQYHVR